MVFGAGEGVEQVVVRVVGESDQQVNFTLLFQTIQLLTSLADPDHVSRILNFIHPRSRISDLVSNNSNKREGGKNWLSYGTVPFL